SDRLCASIYTAQRRWRTCGRHRVSQWVVARVLCIGYPKSLSSLFDFEGTCRGAQAGSLTIPTGRRFLTHGDDQIRTGAPQLAKQVLSQLSYIPNWDLFTRYRHRLAANVALWAPPAADKNG